MNGVLDTSFADDGYGSGGGGDCFRYGVVAGGGGYGGCDDDVGHDVGGAHSGNDRNGCRNVATCTAGGETIGYIFLS